MFFACFAALVPVLGSHPAKVKVGGLAIGPDFFGLCAVQRVQGPGLPSEWTACEPRSNFMEHAQHETAG